MAQIVDNPLNFGAIAGRAVGQGVSSHLDRIIHDRARKIAEKENYERQLKVGKAVNLPNAEQAAFANPEEFMQILKGATGKSSSTSNPEYEATTKELLNYQPGQQQGVMGQAQQPQQALQPQSPEQPQEFFNPLMLNRPDVQEQLLQYMQSPQAQQEYSPEQLQMAQQKLQKYIGARGQAGQPSPREQLMGGAQPQMQSQVSPREQLLVPKTQGLDKEKLKNQYEKALGLAKNKFEKDKLTAIYESKIGAATPAQQSKIEKENRPFLKAMNEYIDNANERSALAAEALALVESGAVTSGPIGLIPESILTSFNQGDADFVKLVGELANRKALELRGPVGKAKIEAAQRTKANLSDPKESKEKVLRREIQNGQKAKALQQAYEEIMAENNQTEPANIEAKIRKRAKEIAGSSVFEDETKPAQNEKRFFDTMPNPAQYTGKRLKSPNGEILISDGRSWIKE